MWSDTKFDILDEVWNKKDETQDLTWDMSDKIETLDMKDEIWDEIQYEKREKLRH